MTATDSDAKEARPGGGLGGGRTRPAPGTWLKSLLAQSFLVLRGYLTFWRTGLTPSSAYASLRGLYCLTHGRFNRMVQAVFGLIRRPYPIGRVQGVLGEMGESEAADALGRTTHPWLRPLWSAAFRRALPRSAHVRARDAQHPLGRGCGRPRAAPRPRKYDFDPADLLKNKTIQELVADQRPRPQT